MMLAYVFWHWPVPGIPLHEYVSRLRTFHDEANDSLPAGMLGSRAWRVGAAPWLPDGPTFEEWYLVENAGGLDGLAEGVASEPLRSPHRAIAGEAGGGTAGLYTPVRSAEGTLEGSLAIWFDKPAGMSYATLFEHLDAVDPDLSLRLWQRFLTLGPTTEFCLLGDEIPTLPDAWHTSVVRRQPVM
ncbi:MAG TPA: hypothetical protein VF221_03460 [Chloroflexota bacterium]